VSYVLDVGAIDQFTGRNHSVDDQTTEFCSPPTRQTGFLAQEVEFAAQEAGFDFSGVDAPRNAHDSYGLRYAEFVVPLVKSVQELAAGNALLQGQVNQLTDQNLTLQKQVDDLADLRAELSELKAMIFQEVNRTVSNQ
jgi:hypothetical protein